MTINRLKSTLASLALATLMALGAGATPALADHQSHSQWQRGQSQHQPGNRQPRYVGNRNGWRNSQCHGNRGHNPGSHSRYHYGNRQHGHQHHGNRHAHGHNRHRGHYRHHGGHYRYHVDGRDVAGAIIGGVVIYHLGRAIFGHH